MPSAVTFAAHMSPGSRPLSQQPLVFDVVDVNEGSGYDRASGVFTAPASGVYLLHASLLNNDQHSADWWGLYKGSTQVCLALLESSRPWDNPTCTTPLHLQAGDTVVVRAKNQDVEQLYGERFCAFSGFLIYAD